MIERWTAWSMLGLAWCSMLFMGGCSLALRPMGSVGLVSVDQDAVPTQMLRPGVDEVECAWSVAWSEPKPLVTVALQRAIGKVPEATMLTNTQLQASVLHLGLLVRACARVRGDAVRRIGEVVLPMLGHPHH